jgi:hypothetical protein
MAKQSVHEETRAEMAYASAELATNLRTLAARLEETQPQTGDIRMLASHMRRLAALFDRLQLEASGARPIHDSNLRTLGRLYEDTAKKLGEAAELVDFVKSQVAVQQMGQRIARVGDLVGQALLLADLRLS